jgi:NTE family protein
VQECVSDDTILVAINPVERPGIPRSAHDIINRVNEVSFNAVLLKELRMIALLRQVADAGNSECAHWAAMRIHMIGSQMLVDLGSSSKLNAEWPFLSMLRDEGRRAAEGFLSAHGEALGRSSTLDIDPGGPGEPGSRGSGAGTAGGEAAFVGVHYARTARRARRVPLPGRRGAA